MDQRKMGTAAHPPVVGILRCLRDGPFPAESV
jgi:hypothetical protein